MTPTQDEIAALVALREKAYQDYINEVTPNGNTRIDNITLSIGNDERHHRHIATQVDMAFQAGWSAALTALQARVAELEGVLAESPWHDPETYPDGNDLVQVLCQVTQPETDDFPRACEMPVSSGDHAVEDLFVSIGWRDDDGDWFVAGWDMTQDCWTNARCFTVKGWQPIARAALPADAKGGE